MSKRLFLEQQNICSILAQNKLELKRFKLSLIMLSMVTSNNIARIRLLCLFVEFVRIWVFPKLPLPTRRAAHCPSKKIGKKVQNIALHCTAYSCIVLFLALLVTPVSSPLGHRISGNLGISNVPTLSPEWGLPSSNKKLQNLVLHGIASHRCLHFTYLNYSIEFYPNFGSLQ